MCGIAGIINQTPREFDYSTFCTLGIANDARGGDSCGVFIDGKCDYGVDKTKLFANYFPDSDFLNNVKTARIALLHCRKASVGVISKETAQPVVLTEGGVVKFVVIHNGTIYNYKELAEKYIPDIDITGLTDSQVMARIFYYAGYDVLDEYNGGSAFAIVDYRGISPRVLLFKGASKRHTYSKEAEVERPLYFCIDKAKRELVFSSIGIYLLALRKDCTTYSVRSNELLEFSGSALVTIKEYSREKCIQTREVAVVPTYNTFPYSRDYLGKWDDYDYSDDTFVYDNYLSCNLLDNTYSYKGKRIHGKLCVNRFGRVESKQKRGIDIWFFNGVAMKNSNCFKFLTGLRKETRLSESEFSRKFENVIRYLSVDGVFRRGDLWYKTISPTGSILFTGTLQQLTSVTTTQFCSGMRQSTSYRRDTEPLESKFQDKLELNFETIREECKSLMK